MDANDGLKGADLVRILEKSIFFVFSESRIFQKYSLGLLFMEINDFEWSCLYLQPNRIKNFKRVFLEAMFPKSVITVT